MHSSTPIAITAEVSHDTLTIIRRMAAERGISVESIASEIVRQAADEEAGLIAEIEEGRRQIAAGDYLTHEQFVAELERWKSGRKRAA